MNPRSKIIQIIFFIICAFASNALAQDQLPNKDLNINGIADVVNKAVVSDQPNNPSSNNDKKPATNNLSKTANPASSKKDYLSLMYSDEETRKIQEALDAFKDGKPLIDKTQNTPIEDETAESPPEDNAKSYIYLGSILYSSPNKWSVWINDHKISSSNNKPSNELYIKSINEDEVNIVWIMSTSKWKILTNTKSDDGAPINANNQVEFDFTLSFNQTYMLNGNKTVEGKMLH